MDASKLKVGETYFLVTYPDVSLTIPIVLSYCYLGINLVANAEHQGESEFFFQFLPPFKTDQVDDPTIRWRKEFPGLFKKWGESAPTTFSNVSGFCDTGGLIAELEQVRERLRNS